jgi:hypothetical protein
VSDKLTPTEDLLLEVLIARHRLGEPFWPFDYCHRRTLQRLESRGLVSFQNAVTPHLRAQLTAAGRERFMTHPYVPTGAQVQWASQCDDEAEPTRYDMHEPACEEETRARRRAARYGGRLFRRAVVKMPWEPMPVEVERG